MGDEEQKESVFIALPSYDGQISIESASIAYTRSTKKYQKIIMSSSGSLLGMNFNILWCNALNARVPHGVKWFAMLHGDIIPQDPFWIDTLIGEAENHGADLISAVVPIKDPSGYTSTGFSDPSNQWAPCFRLTQTQLKALPVTFDADACKIALMEFGEDCKVCAPYDSRLLVNTGCMVVRMTQPWVEHLHFTIQDRVYKNDAGEWTCSVIPEDWNFSQQVADFGGRVFATKAVPVKHKGSANYDSTAVWGNARDHLLDKRTA